MEIYEKIRYYREHTDLSQRNVAKILSVSRKIGNPGSGKTHLSIALGMNACEGGYRVKFCRIIINNK